MARLPMRVAQLKIKYLIFVFLSCPAWGQLPLFQTYQLSDKNEVAEVHKILQDKTGFMWFGTGNGLFKFDGLRYEAFAGKLPDENVTALAQDSVGRLWIGFGNGKIGVIDKNKFSLFTPEEGLPAVQISDILFDREGVLWFSTYNDGIYYYFNNRLYRVDDMDGMPDLFAYDLEEDPQGRIWVGTDGGVAICARTKNTVLIKTINYSNGLPDNIIRKISKENANAMLLASEDAGVFQFNTLADTVVRLLETKWPFGSVIDFLNVDDWTWVATTQGVVLIDHSDSIPLVTRLSTDHATALGYDAEGGVWVASTAGVQHTMGKRVQFLEPEANKNVVAVTVGREGDVWFSTSSGLFRKTKRNGKIVITAPLPGSFRDKSVISLFTDVDGFVWAGFYGDGAIRINPANMTIKYFRKELLNGSVVNISGKNKTVWLATLGGASEIKIDQNFSVKNYSQADGLATDYLYQIFTDSRNRVWFATDRDGVDMLDANGFHHFKENLFLKVVYGFAEDSSRQVWANVQNEGLFIFDGKKFSPFAKQGNLHHTNFNSFSSGRNGQLVVSHDSGMDCFDPAKNKFGYLLNGGFVGRPNLNAIATDHKEVFFVGTNNGLLIYNNASSKRQYAPTPLIDWVEVNGQPFDVSKLDQLSYAQNNITIGFTAFWYQNPGALRFSYKLEEFDDKWITSESRSVKYPKLPPGEYSFRLKVSDSPDFSNAVETKVVFVVKPPFWSTAWFYTLVVVALLISSYSFITYRERKLVSDKRALEANVVRRTLEIQQKSTELKMQAEKIKLINENLESIVKHRTNELEVKNKALEEYAFINAHKLRAPLARILGLVHLMKKNDVSEDERMYMEHLHLASRELDDVIGSITDALERGTMEPGRLNLD